MLGSNLLKTLAIALQLAMFLFVIERRFEVESPAFRLIARLAAGGFVVHAFLPKKLRLPFFTLLSVTGILWILGPAAGSWVVGLSLALLGICHLPAPFRTRMVLLGLTVAALAAMRAQFLPAPFSAAVWPVLGAMFMFRLIIYIYDLRHEKDPVSPWSRLAYFFLLPNVCFPLFPVVDWKNFLRTYYDTDEHRIYQKGMQWMFRGLVHLILYRLIYYRLALPMEQVANVGDLGRFLVANYLLYLRISGQFHIIVGMLGLFGFNLPETNRLYLLASSFSDYWRRINIYWKDFMVKVFYYPAFFRLRNRPTRALVLATAYVFVVTWALHSYQWFWLRGAFPVTGPDLAFWALLGFFVVMNSLQEQKSGRRRTLGTKVWTWRESFDLSLRTVGMFAGICILWSLWTSGSLSNWSALWIVGEPGWTEGWQLVLGFLALAIVAGAGVRYYVDRVGPLKVAGNGLDFRRSVAVTAGALFILAAIGNRRVAAVLPAEVADTVLSLRKERLNEGDLALLTRGYYEDLLGVDRVNSQVWELYMKEPPGWYGEIEVMYRDTGDFLGREHVPLAKSVAKNLPVEMNRWGMRDRDYEKEKPAGTFRAALMGDSYAVGLGVPPDSTWESLVEARLSASPPAGFERAEILNFSVGGHRTVQRIWALESRALAFQPDVVFYLAHENDLASLKDLADALRQGVPVPYEHLAEIGARANVGPDTPEAAAERRLQKFGEEIVSWTYRRAVEACKERGVQPVWLFMRTTTEGEWRDAHTTLRRLAEEAGFVIVDLEDTYGDVPMKSLFLAEWDQHPDLGGHRLIADRVWAELQKRPEVFGAQRPSTATAETASANETRESQEVPQ